MAELHFYRHRYYLLFCIVIFIIVNFFFIDNNHKRIAKEEYIRIDNLSVIHDTPYTVTHKKLENITLIKNIISSPIHIDNCKDEWTNDIIVGRCFGLDDVNNATYKMTAQQCKEYCCNKGKDCITWQYIDSTQICKNGGPVRIGGEGFQYANLIIRNLIIQFCL